MLLFRILIILCLLTTSVLTLLLLSQKGKRAKEPAALNETNPGGTNIVALVSHREFCRAFRRSGYLSSAKGNAADAFARTGQRDLTTARKRYSKAHVSRAYSQNTRALTSLDTLCREVDHACKQAGYGKMLLIPWKFAILQEGTDNNFPHTLGAIICLPEPLLKDCTRIVYGASDRHTKKKRHDICVTLLHEKIHVFQRAFPEDTSKYVKERLGYVKLMLREHLPSDLKSRTRSNPDMDDNIYRSVRSVKTAKCAPLTVFRSATPRGLWDADLQCFLLNDKKVKPNEIQGSHGYRYEHPFEHMAYELSADIMMQASKTS